MILMSLVYTELITMIRASTKNCYRGLGRSGVTGFGGKGHYYRVEMVLFNREQHLQKLQELKFALKTLAEGQTLILLCGNLPIFARSKAFLAQQEISCDSRSIPANTSPTGFRMCSQGSWRLLDKLMTGGFLIGLGCPS